MLLRLSHFVPITDENTGPPITSDYHSATSYESGQVMEETECEKGSLFCVTFTCYDR